MRVALLLATALLAQACGNPCQDLAAKICQCEIGRNAQTACERRAAQIASQDSGLTEAEQSFCEARIEGCDCFALGTAEGKRACGLAE